MENFSLRSLDNEKARCNLLWGLRFELRDRIANIPRNNLNEVINVVTNYELILEQAKATKKSSFALKSGVPS